MISVPNSNASSQVKNSQVDGFGSGHSSLVEGNSHVSHNKNSQVGGNSPTTSPIN